MTTHTTKMLIIGSGPAGYTAAVYAARANKAKHAGVDAFMRAVLAREAGLRMGAPLTHVFHMTAPGREKPLLISDRGLETTGLVDRAAILLVRRVGRAGTASGEPRQQEKRKKGSEHHGRHFFGSLLLMLSRGGGPRGCGRCTRKPR